MHTHEKACHNYFQGLFSKCRTIIEVVKLMKNFPLFFYDYALTGRRQGDTHFIYRLRDGTSFAVRPFTDDKWVLTDIWMKNYYWHPDFLPFHAHPVILDIGAHIGGWAINTMRAYPTGTIYAFEPVLETFNILKKNIKLNHFERNIIPIHAAIAPESGTMELFYDPQKSAFTSLSQRSTNEKGVKQQVKTVTLPDIIQEYELNYIDLVKSDIEGGEFEFLPKLDKSITDIIGNFSVEYHLFEKHYHLEDLIGFFKARNFSLLEHDATLPDSGYIKLKNNRPPLN